MISSTIEFVKSRRKSVSKNFESKEVRRETSENFEVSDSMGDQPSRNLTSIPQGSNVFILKSKIYLDTIIEDKFE